MPQRTFKLNVEIAPNQLLMLKQNGFLLCIAMQVNGVYTVVWSGTSSYFLHQTFEWIDEYQVFGAKNFEIGAPTEAITNAADIQFGQTCVLNAAGVMEDASGVPHNSGIFHVKNEFDPTDIGVKCKLVGGEFSPISVSPAAIVGTGRFEPVNSIKVWFSRVQKTGTMIFDWDTRDKEGAQVIYAGSETEKSLLYSGPDGFGQWTLVDSAEPS